MPTNSENFVNIVQGIHPYAAFIFWNSIKFSVLGLCPHLVLMGWNLAWRNRPLVSISATSRPCKSYSSLIFVDPTVKSVGIPLWNAAVTTFGACHTSDLRLSTGQRTQDDQHSCLYFSQMLTYSKILSKQLQNWICNTTPVILPIVNHNICFRL